MQKDTDIRTDAELCMVRWGRGGELLSVAICKGKTVHVGDAALDLQAETDFVEFFIDAGSPAVVAGDGILA